jgi:hypothetical protein
MRGERPAVDGEDPYRHARCRGRQAREDSRLRAVRVDDVGTLTPAERVELPQAERVARPDGATHVPERDVADAGLARGVAQRSRPPSGDDDVEFVRERRQELCNVRLRAADLGERDRDQESRAGSYDVVGATPSWRWLNRKSARTVRSRIFKSSHGDQFST